MRFCVWDTSSKVGSVALFEAQPEAVRPECRAELTLDATAVHSERLLWAIDELLTNQRWKIRDLDFLAVGRGPGSFTGLRIGVTTARSLAQGLDAPVVGFSSLRALGIPIAEAAAEKTGEPYIIASTDAAKGELFVAGGEASQWRNGGPKERVMEPAAMRLHLEQVLSQRGSDAPWIAVGEAVLRYPRYFEGLPGERREPREASSHSVRAAELGTLVWREFLEKKAVRFSELHPNYLRASSAEQKLRAGALPPGPTRI
ncbi:MAG: tRNA (adenosine(37)-N6)-threonylcarbamoyltransferase complex dimerization subunit type 1 TsaB [Bacteriovoracia bacterium]